MRPSFLSTLQGNAAPRLNGSEFLPFAHHPHCERHRHHLIWFAGHPLCLGCTCMALGTPIGAVLAITAAPSNWETTSLGLALVGCLILPTTAQPFFQRKTFKIAARTSLGIAVGLYWVGGAIALLGGAVSPLWAVAWVGAFIGIYKALSWWRLRRTDDPCRQCPLGTYPTCDWNMPRLMKENADDPVFQSIQVTSASKV